MGDGSGGWGQAIAPIMAFVNDFFQGQQQSAANVENLRGHQQGTDLLDALYGDKIPEANAFAGLQNQRLADVQSTGSAGWADLVGGYGDRYKRGMSLLEGMGEQERTDIGTQYDNLGARTQSGATSRGLSGTTVMPSLMRDVERERTGALGRHEERMRQQTMSADARLSGDWLGAQSAANTWDVNQMMNAIGAASSIEGARVAPQYDYASSMLNWLSQKNVVGPAQAPFMQQQGAWGQVGAGPYDPPDTGSDGSGALMGGGIGAGVGAAALSLAGGGLPGAMIGLGIGGGLGTGFGSMFD